jgi:protein-arginine kinase activator protein McsA
MADTKNRKCDQCNKNPATLYFVQVDDKGHPTSRASLCNECAMKTIPHFLDSPKLSKTNNPPVQSVQPNDGVFDPSSKEAEVLKTGHSSDKCKWLNKDPNACEKCMAEATSYIEASGKGKPNKAVTALSKLHEELINAIKEERFEDAAKIRDDILSLTKSGKKAKSSTSGKSGKKIQKGETSK